MRFGGRAGGMSLLETLIALPILLMFGLGALQAALVLQARHALNFALLEAARSGSVEHASPEAVRAGLARGLLPWLYGASDLSEYASNLARASLHLAQGEGTGWLILDQLSPTPESFNDWAEPARNANGELIEGLREIPNDNLAARSASAQPASGVSGRRGNEAIGMVSGQTLTDANLLRLRLDYGVPLVVPVVGRLMASVLRSWDGCEAGAPQRLGALRLGTPGNPIAPRLWPCLMYGQSRQSGAAEANTPRIPVRVLVTVRMQSPAREAGIGGVWGQGLAPVLGAGSGLAAFEPDGEQAPTLPGPTVITDSAVPLRDSASEGVVVDAGAVSPSPGASPQQGPTADPAVCTEIGV